MSTTGFSAHPSNFSAFKAWYKREVLWSSFLVLAAVVAAPLRPAAGAQPRREVKSTCRGNRFRHAEN